MVGIFSTRFWVRILKGLFKSSKKKRAEALAMERRDEEFALVLQLHELSLELSQEIHRESESSLNLQDPSSASTSDSRTPNPGAVACSDPEADFLRALHITLPVHIIEKECGICLEAKPESSFVSTPDCAHEFCSDCCKGHAEAKIMSGSTQIKCPEGSCAHHFDMEQSQELLSPSSFEALNARLTEAAIPAALKVYCPFVDCAVFMERSANLRAAEPFAECYACHRGFCFECRVPWHGGQTCAEYEANEMNNKLSGDQKLRDLAKQEKWQHCPDCQRTIALKHGCNHMTCLCGLEFCYLCGTKWEDRKQVCDCGLFDERALIEI